MAHYWASCAGGLEFVLIKELEGLEGTKIIPGVQSYGGVQFQTMSSPQRVAQLKSADNVYAFLSHYKNIPLDKEAGVTFMRLLVAKIEWKPVMELHKQWRESEEPESGPRSNEYETSINGLVTTEIPPAAQHISFRVTGDRICMNMKKHGYTSMDAAAAIGDGIHELLGWPADMKSYNVEVLAWIVDDELLLVLALIYSGNRKKARDVQDSNKVDWPSVEKVIEGERMEASEQALLVKKKRTADRPSRADAQDRNYVEKRGYVSSVNSRRLWVSIISFFCALLTEKFGVEVDGYFRSQVSDSDVSLQGPYCLADFLLEALDLRRNTLWAAETQELYSRRPYRQALVHTSLKPSTAYALLQLAQVEPGDIVLDPMCGCGTIPLEANDWLGRRVMGIAGDFVDRAVESARLNSIGGDAAGPCDVVQWDAGLLPLRTASIDRVICDMPFGNRCGNFKVRDWLCPKVVKQVVRVLRPGTGLAVLMAQSKTMKEEVEVNQKAYLDLQQHMYIHMEGLRVDVFVVRRTTEPAPTHVVRMSKNMAKRKRDWQQTKQKPVESYVSDDVVGTDSHQS